MKNIIKFTTVLSLLMLFLFSNDILAQSSPNQGEGYGCFDSHASSQDGGYCYSCSIPCGEPPFEVNSCNTAGGCECPACYGTQVAHSGANEGVIQFYHPDGGVAAEYTFVVGSITVVEVDLDGQPAYHITWDTP